MTVAEITKQFASGNLSAVELVDSYLANIERSDTFNHAYIDVYSREARMAAEAADLARRSGHSLGAFHGLPFGLKDIVDVKGKITTGGSMAWRERVSTATASFVQRLVGSGLIILGKTHTVEFAFGAWGTNQHLGAPRNPWDRKQHRTPGGSSSGSAVAVATRMAPWAVGSDTGGSIRIPSSFCGLTGLKTTVGVVATDNVIPLSTTLDTIGPIARSAEDAALIFDLLRSPSERQRSRRLLRQGSLKGLRFGMISDVERAVVTEGVLRAYDQSLRELEALGAEIAAVPDMPDLSVFTEMASAMLAMEGYSFKPDMIDDDSVPLDEQVRGRFRAGRKLFGGDYLALLRERERSRATFDKALEGFDAYLTPTTPTTAIPVSEVETTKFNPGHFTRPVNLMERCAVAVPNGMSEGLPTSLQIICAGHEDDLALDIARAFQTATQWHLAQPEGV
ncbi:amidase [Bradyrhizobium lablabi]|nr:amidase [Bradyrhizobium lablabi]MBR1122531.1 amidase [Bradyrhizobium lablabi]